MQIEEVEEEDLGVGGYNGETKFSSPQRLES